MFQSEKALRFIFSNHQNTKYQEENVLQKYYAMRSMYDFCRLLPHVFGSLIKVIKQQGKLYDPEKFS